MPIRRSHAKVTVGLFWAESWLFRSHFFKRYRLQSSVLNHSTLEFRDFSKREPGSWFHVRSTYFWTLIPNHPTWRRVEMLPRQVIGKKLHWSRDITWHVYLREKVKFLVSVRVLVVVWVMVVVRVMVRVRIEC